MDHTLALLLWSFWCGVKCEWEFNMSSVCWRKQVLQLVVMETKCMMLTCFSKITSWKRSRGSIFFERGSLSFTKTAEQYKNTIVCGGLGGGGGAVCTWHFSLSWAASLGWLNRSMVPLPSCVMAPRGNRRGKEWQITNLLTSLNVTIWYKLCTSRWIMHYTVRKTGRG